MAQFVLENYEARVVIDEHASEIHSFVDRDTDNEYMCRGIRSTGAEEIRRCFRWSVPPGTRPCTSTERNIIQEIMALQEGVILPVWNMMQRTVSWN